MHADKGELAVRCNSSRSELDLRNLPFGPHPVPSSTPEMNLKLKLAVLTAVLAVSASAFAAPLAPASGSITISGVDSWDATSITFASQGTVQSATGTFAFLSGRTVDLTSFTFANSNGVALFATPGTPLSALSHFFINGPVNVVTDTPQLLNITGLGTFDEFLTLGAPGSFSLTSSASGNFSFRLDASTAAPTPEPNSLVLIGTGLASGAGMLMRRRRAIA